MRKLGLDVGMKSCGIAISDSLNITAQGKETFLFEAKNWNVLIKKVQSYLQMFAIDTIVIGHPTLPSGDKSSTTRMIEEFKNKLEQKTSCQIVFVDENHTTKQAHKIMIKAGLTRAKRKKFKDQIAAQFILKNYLSKL